MCLLAAGVVRELDSLEFLADIIPPKQLVTKTEPDKREKGKEKEKDPEVSQDVTKPDVSV